MKILNDIYKAENVFGEAIVRLAAIRGRMEEREVVRKRETGLTPQQSNIMTLLLFKHPEAQSPGDIKSDMLFKTSDLTRLVDRLVKKGLLHRSTNPENRRQVSIRLTDEGLKLAQQQIEFAKKEIPKIFENVTEQEARILVQILEKIKI